MDQSRFAQTIREARKEKGMTQKELASRLHVTDKAVSKWERALSFPDVELIGPLAEALELPLADLLGVEDTVSEAENPGTLEIPKQISISYNVLQRHWYDKEDPSIAYIQFFYMEAENTLYESEEVYEKNNQEPTKDADLLLKKIYIETGEQKYE